MTPVAIHERNMETGFEVVTFGIEGEAPIGSMNALDQADPLALTPSEAEVVASWDTENSTAANGETVVTEYGSAEKIVSAESAADLEILTGMKEDKSGLLLPASEVEESAKSGFFSGLKEKATDFIQKHPKLAKTAAVAGAVGTLAAAAPDSAQASWTNLGGDPLVPGGVNSRADFVRAMTSHKGKTAMAYAGLNGKEISAVVRGAREGDEYRCEMPYGEKFKAMSFGINGTSVDKNVRFKDPDFKNDPADAWCMTVPVDLNKDGKVDEKLFVKVPEICGNFGLVKVVPVRHPRHPHPKKPHAPVFVAKEAFGENGDRMKFVPSGVFHAIVRCKYNGKPVSNTLDINMGPKNSAVFALKCDIGKKVTAYELDPTSPNDQWEFLNARFQKQTVRKKGNLFTFKDRQVKPNQPGQPTPTCEETQPKENCYPKNGVDGPGTVNPGQDGGSGSGGSGNTSQNSIACYDIATKTDGDMNDKTEGAPMWGTAKDQNDNCVGPATAA